MTTESTGSADDASAVEWAAKLAEEEISQLREGMERWRNAIATATGVVGAALIFKGADPAAGLPQISRVTVYVLLVGAVVAGVTASYFAVLASTGRPVRRPAETTVADVHTWLRKRTSAIVMRYRMAIGLSGLMIILIIVSLGIGWFAPRSETRIARVETLDGRVLCGTFVRLDQQNLVVTVFGQEMTIPRNSVRALGESKSCG